MKNDSGVVEWLQRLALNEERSVRFRPPVLIDAQVRKRGIAARLKPARVWVRFPPWVLDGGEKRLGRQLEDHGRPDRLMLRVRLPPEQLMNAGYANLE
jgi:hypothetical protein